MVPAGWLMYKVLSVAARVREAFCLHHLIEFSEQLGE